MKPARISVGIPTFARGIRVGDTIERLLACDPPPAEIIVHVDQSDGQLESQLAARFPSVRCMSSPKRVGPGGGRHRCIHVASQPFFVSFDDDSWPLDNDFFAEVEALFEKYPRAAVLAANISHPGETVPGRVSDAKVVTDYTGCGYAVRVDAYRQTAGHIDRDWAYGIEEVDLSLQLHALEWTVLRCGSLRVFHDTRNAHHCRPEIVAAAIQNIALLVFLRYPVRMWPRGILQIGNIVLGMIRQRRFAGLARGVFGIPVALVRYAHFRHQLPAAKVRSYLNARPKLTS